MTTHWKPGDPDRRRSQVRCQPEVFNKISDLEDRFRSVEKQLLLLISAVDSEKGNTTRIMDDMSEMLRNHQKTLYGDGDKNNPGNCERINNLETIEKDRKFYLGSMFVAICGLIVNLFFEWITGK